MATGAEIDIPMKRIADRQGRVYRPRFAAMVMTASVRIAFLRIQIGIVDDMLW